MRRETKIMLGGAALGAVLGAVAGIMLARRGQGQDETPHKTDARQIMRVGTSVVGLVRQILEL